MENDSSESLRPYKVRIWAAEKFDIENPENELEIMAGSGSHAKALVFEKYGEGHIYSVWNEEDASKPR